MHRIVATSLVLIGCALPAGLRAQTPPARAADVASPQAVVAAVYESLQRKPGENFDWPRFRSLHLPEATLIPNTEQTGGAFRVLTVQQFIDWVDGVTTVGGPSDTGFAEEELTHCVRTYGDVAQVWSSYQKHFWGSTQILGRGINAIHLVRRDGRWWIVSSIWDEESGAGPLPDPMRGVGGATTCS